MDKKLFYTYTGNWSNYVLPTSELYPNSIIFHENTRRILQNGKIYGGDGNIYIIEGNSDGTAGQWTGTHDAITEYYNGLTIVYIIRTAGASTTKLNINNLGACTCYFSGTSKLTTHFGVGTPIILTYVDGKWTRADYNIDTNTHTYTTKVYNKDGQDLDYNIVFTNGNTDGAKTYAYIDNGEFFYNPSTNTLTVRKIKAILESLNIGGYETVLSNENRRVISNIALTDAHDITYTYSESIGARYFNGTSYLGEIFSDYANNVASGKYSSAFGYYNISSNSYETSFGSYNKSNTNQIFSIGIGTSNTDRKNAICVYTDGTTYVHDIIPEGNKVCNLGKSTGKFNTIYSETFNGDVFTGTSKQVEVYSNNNTSDLPIVGYCTTVGDNKNKLFYESNIKFSHTGQLQIQATGTTPPLWVSNKSKIDRLNSDLLDGKHANELLELAYIDSSSSSSELTYYIKVGGKEISGKRKIYAEKFAGTTSYTAWGQTFWSNGVPNSVDGNIIPGTSNTSYLGSSSKKWQGSYIDSIYARKVIFNNSGEFGTNTQFIYWNQGVPTPSNGTIGSTSKPIYLNNGTFMECSKDLDVTINTGIANRVAYYSSSDGLTSSNITTNGNYLGNVNYLSINNAHQTTYRLYVNGTSYFNNKMNMYSTSCSYLNMINGIFSISLDNNSIIYIDASAFYPGKDSSYNLGYSNYKWNDGYINNIYNKETHTEKIGFTDASGTFFDFGQSNQPIYWKDGVPKVSDSSIGSDTKPIYLKNGVFTECSKALDFTINSGTANRIAWYSNTKTISSGSIVTDGSYLGSVGYLSINNAHQTTYRLLVNGNSMFKNTINIDSSTMGVVSHISFTRNGFNYITIPSGGTLAIGVGPSGANTRLAIDSTKVYPGQNNNIIDLGASSYKWKNGYINNIYTKKISFYVVNDNDSSVTFGTNTQFIFWNEGVPTPSNSSTGSDTQPIYLKNGVFTACKSYADYDTSLITTIKKTLTVTTSWQDTGISGTNIGTGSYIVQMSVGGTIYYSGVISWYSTSTNTSETDEIVLHAAGNNISDRLYLKTTTTAKLQISGSNNWSSAKEITFKFKKIL